MSVAMTKTPELNDDARWQIALAKDRRFDGRFVTGVLSTGIYCRPSCPARPPKRENVRFFASPADAEAAGLRACLRCRPEALARDEAAVAEAIALLRHAEAAVPLDQLADAVGYSATHFQKVFKRAVGLSPAAYQRAARLERAADALSAGETVTGAIYDAGYSAPSRFYEASGARLGMAPSAWAAGGRGVTIRWAVVATTLGPMLVAATDKGVCRLSFGERREALEARFPNAKLEQGGGDFAELAQHVVWQELRRIPAGETRSYAQIAAAVGKPGAVRATGSANGANNVAVLIPCHRVVRSDGTMGGYAYGLEIKQRLLDMERSRPGG